jgi:CubicO group peptidase (beta-lactamase class C family)
MPLRKSAYWFIFFLVAGFHPCSAQHLPSGLSDFIREKADSLYRESKVPGIFIGIISGGKKNYFSCGYADPGEKKMFDSATIFEAGSITKTFTAYVLVSILEENRIPDTASIIRYLPDSVAANSSLANISFLSLMNHTSGLPRLPENMKLSLNDKAPYDNYGADKLFACLKTVTPKPNGKSNYSNLGMGLAGVLAERISGKTYAALLDEYILLPFKMVATAQPVKNDSKKSQGYFGEEKAPYWNMDVLAPAGGLKCTADEMLAYLDYMMKPLEEKSGKRISKVLEPTIELNSKMKICRAWIRLQDENNPAIYWHNGGTYGFSTFAAFNIETRQAVVVVVNKFNSNQVSDGLGMRIMKKMLE